MGRTARGSPSKMTTHSPVLCCLRSVSRQVPAVEEGESDDECSMKVALADYSYCPSRMPSARGLLWGLWSVCNTGRPPSIVSDPTAPCEEPTECSSPSSFPYH